MTTRAAEHGTASGRDPSDVRATGRAAPEAAPDSATYTFIHERAAVLMMRLCAALPALGAAFFAIAPSLVADRAPSAHGPWFVVAVIVLAGCSVLTVRLARRMERYAFTVAPQGFREAPRHDTGTLIAWSRVARFVHNAWGPRFELRDARGDVLGALQWGVLDFEQAFEAILAHVPQRPAPLPATYAWNTSWAVIVAVTACICSFGAYGLDRWLRYGDPAGAVFVLGFPLIAAISALTVRWRTEIHHDGVVVHRGIAHREVRWRDVTAVTLSQSHPFDVALRLTNYCTVQICPTDGDPICVLATSRAAHAAYVAYTAALSAADPRPPGAAARTP